MSKFSKFILYVIVFIYALSPVDVYPGPIDDLIVIILSLFL